LVAIAVGLLLARLFVPDEGERTVQAVVAGMLFLLAAFDFVGWKQGVVGEMGSHHRPSDGG
jgi:hypothetical protein